MPRFTVTLNGDRPVFAEYTTDDDCENEEAAKQEALVNIHDSQWDNQLDVENVEVESVAPYVEDVPSHKKKGEN